MRPKRLQFRGFQRQEDRVLPKWVPQLESPVSRGIPFFSLKEALGEAGYAPDLYGHLASPDLTGDTNVDSSDLSAFSDYLGDAITREWGWQADFNHSGGYVDAGDLSYFSARWGKSCSSSKAGDAYMADVNNLENAGIQALMARAGITAADVLAYWDAQGWTYDRDVATRIASASLERRDWGSVKQIFR
jgi:hypothetical protein